MKHFKRTRTAGFSLRRALFTSWREHRLLLWVLFACIALGVGIAFFVILDPLLNHLRISQDLLDSNIVNMASPNRSLFNFILARFSDFLFAFLLVLFLCMTRWTMPLVFPYIAFRAFWAVINIFWIVDRFGFLHSFLLLFVYILVFIVMLIIFAAACVFALKRGAQCRTYGWRAAYQWREIKWPIFKLMTAITVVAFFEWFLYFLIISRMIFVIN